METVNTADHPRERTRRALDLDTESQDSMPQATPEMAKLAKMSYVHNRDKNAETRKERSANKALAALMAKVEGLCYFIAKHQGKTLEVKYGPGETEYVDVDILVKKVGAKEVLAIASVSKGDVERLFGTNTVNACLATKGTEHKLTVKEKKKGG